MNIVLISTYELGRQPFGLASPAAWLRKGGHTVSSLDLSRQPLDEAAASRSEEHTSELQSPCNLVCRLLLEKKKKHAALAETHLDDHTETRLREPAAPP